MSYAERERSAFGGEPYELYLFETADAAWRLTSSDADRTHGGALYSSAAVSRTANSSGGDVKGGRIKVSLPADHPVARLFVARIPSTPLTLVVRRGHDGEPESETVAAFAGRVMSGVFTTDDLCELQCASDTEVLRRRIATRTFQRPCNHVLYGKGCGLSGVAWRTPGTAASVSADGLTVEVPEAAQRPDGWFSLGYVERGYDRAMVETHAGGALTLLHPLPGLRAGDAVAVYAGCDRTYSGENGCVPKFGNGANFMGWEWIPSKNPFSSGLE